MKRTITISVLSIAMLLSSGVVFAWPGSGYQINGRNFRGHSEHGMNQEQHQEQMETRLKRMGIILGLTEQQKNKLQSLSEKQWEKRQALRVEMQANQKDFRNYRQSKEFNPDEFRIKVQKFADLKAEMIVQRATAREQIFAILTPEQQQKAEDLRELRGKGFRNATRQLGDCDGQWARKQKGHGKRYQK